MSIWLLKGFFDNIPPELERAARIDGATRFQAFWMIVLPLSSPGIIATAIYAFIQGWNEYVYARTFLTTEEKLTMPIGLGKFFTENSQQLARSDGRIVHHERAGGGAFPAAAALLRAGADRRRGEDTDAPPPFRRSGRGMTRSPPGRSHGYHHAEQRRQDVRRCCCGRRRFAEVHDGEFVALVGPSGCGKTTTLNLVAGLIEITDGEIYLGERKINDLDPKDRDIAMVFQNYALYPNKTVAENLAFPLRCGG